MLKKDVKVDHFLTKFKEIVDLDVEKFPSEEDRQIVSATACPGLALIVKESSKDLYASVDIAVDKLQRQLKKYKQKLRLKSRKKAMKTKRDIQKISLNMTGESPTQSSNEEDPSTLFVKKPMHPEDAALILEDLEQSFYWNASNEKINVIYRTNVMVILD